MSYWYVAHSNELLIDLDNYMRPAPSKTGESRGPWGEVFFRRRLADAIRADRLQVCDPPVYLDRSNSERHWHAIVRLRYQMPLIERLVWQLRLGSDLMRGQADLMRAAKGIDFPSLLIRHTRFTDFYREPDYECACTRKHDTNEQLSLNGDGCPVWRKLRGLTPWQLFGPTHHGNHHGVKLPIGKVPLADILKIDEEKKMKPFETVTVCVEFRMVGVDGEAPRDRLLRARVVETVTQRGGVCRAYGDELIAPRKLTDRNMGDIHRICLEQLRRLTKRVIFRYDELLQLGPEEFPIGDAA